MPFRSAKRSPVKRSHSRNAARCAPATFGPEGGSRSSVRCINLAMNASPAAWLVIVGAKKILLEMHNVPANLEPVDGSPGNMERHLLWNDSAAHDTHPPDVDAIYDWVSRRVPSTVGHRFSKSTSLCSPRFRRAWIRRWASGHVSAVSKEVRASRS